MRLITNMYYYNICVNICIMISINNIYNKSSQSPDPVCKMFWIHYTGRYTGHLKGHYTDHYML